MKTKHLPQNAQPIKVEGSTVPFYVFEDKGITYYQFDTSLSGPPEPMVNAMAGLRLLTDASKKLVMINHKKPMGLFDKIGKSFSYIIENLPDGNVKIVFSYNPEASEKADLTQTSCKG